MDRTCAHCGAPARFLLRQDGVEQWACETCASGSSALSAIPTIATAMRHRPLREGACPHCGTIEADVVRSGMVGCPLCYVAFDERVWNTMGLQKGTWSRTNVW